MNLIGGIRRDLLKEDMIQTRQLARQLRRDVQELVDMLLSTPNMEQRTVGIGRLDGNRPRLQQRRPDGARQQRCAHDTAPTTRLSVTACCRWKSTASRAATVSRLKVRINEVYRAEYD
ncbi:hypothetical protein MJ585_21815 [Klebsiella pneumoniae]|nr:hypothetical protein MJ585_21815 [Klebsiella pneumoniae]